ncbi:hypothetical protein ES677_08280 [Bizionia gelidisalsuginis]|uniref:Lipocalin-like domain-containing protein n=1 Tax=Bizionia gelidisalsuginis TaxID=291188 RepID=A0ABY3MA82_9FLAO|nr:DUF6252 family protein [Bizionia gelidisalsuginis]TYC12652.1 hypothetical protein ES677_08280 [Bizionia gelidisalsuginis]
MKNLLLAFAMLLIVSNCNKNDDDQPTNPIDQLPPATQTGAQTFGCLINGEAFVPPSFGSNSPSAFYQFVGGAYTLGISGGTGGGTELKSINLGCLDMPLIEEINYNLLEFVTGNYFGEYYLGGGNGEIYSTTVNNPGTLTITRFDQDNFIISGTFEFTVVDNDGNEINITNGRFDMNYTN